MDRNNLTDKMCGWLHLRTVFSKKWKKQWFVLEKNYLLYGDSEKDVSGKIPLDNAQLRETTKDQRPCAFSLKPNRGKRTYYLSGDDDLTRMKWMQAICFAKVNHSEDECTTKPTSCFLV